MQGFAAQASKPVQHSDSHSRSEIYSCPSVQAGPLQHGQPRAKPPDPRLSASPKPKPGETPAIRRGRSSLPFALAQGPPYTSTSNLGCFQACPFSFAPVRQSLTSFPSESDSNLLGHPHHQPQARQIVLRALISYKSILNLYSHTLVFQSC